MSKLYIIFITILYITNIAILNAHNKVTGDTNMSQLLLISESALRELYNLNASKKSKINQFRSLIEKKSSGVVLIYTISDYEFDPATQDLQARAFYNSAMKPRKKNSDYKYGVTCGVVISESGLVVTTYNGIMNSDRYFISIDSEKNKEDNTYSDIVLDGNTYKAHLVRTFPGLNLAFLQIETNKNEKFDAINITNDAFLIRKDGSANHLIYNAMVIGKCKGEHYVTSRIPFNTRNRFDKYCVVIGGVSYTKKKGTPTLVLYTPVTGDGAIPENHGGALIKWDGKLLGIPVYEDNGISLPYSAAIPASTIKKALGLLQQNINNTLSFGLEVKNLNNNEKTLLKNTLKNKFGDIDKKLLDKLNSNKIFDDYLIGGELVDTNGLGVIVKSITSDAPGAQAGILRGDIILKINDDYITDTETFYNVEKHSIDKTHVTVVLLRDKKIITLEVRK